MVCRARRSVPPPPRHSWSVLEDEGGCETDVIQAFLGLARCGKNSRDLFHRWPVLLLLLSLAKSSRIRICDLVPSFGSGNNMHLSVIRIYIAHAYETGIPFLILFLLAVVFDQDMCCLIMFGIYSWLELENSNLLVNTSKICCFVLIKRG